MSKTSINEYDDKDYLSLIRYGEIVLTGSIVSGLLIIILFAAVAGSQCTDWWRK